MPQQTAPAESVTFELLEKMLQTRFEGNTQTLKQTIENAVQVCVAATYRHTQPSSLTVKISFATSDDGQIDIVADVDAKLPKPKPMPVRLYGTRSGELFADDPGMVHPKGMFGNQPAAVVAGDKKGE